MNFYGCLPTCNHICQSRSLKGLLVRSPSNPILIVPRFNALILGIKVAVLVKQNR